MTSLEIKHAVMWYFRFQRQWICASECINNDVMAFTDKYAIEVEVKISKSDLWHGEKKKDKHRQYNNIGNFSSKVFEEYIPNKFYICVPYELNEEAEKWVEEINPKYGIIICKKYWNNCLPHDILIAKTAHFLHKCFSNKFKKAIMMRVCSENIGLIEKKILAKGGQNEKSN